MSAVNCHPRRKPINHGTIGGHRAHSRHGEPVCEPCRDAHRRSQGQKPLQPAKCGTRSGYMSHHRRGEEACADCKTATAAYERARRAQHAKQAAR